MSRTAAQHPTAMNSPTRPRPRQAQAPRDYDDRGPSGYHTSAKAGPSGPPPFSSHDDFYDFLESNRGPMPGPSTFAGPGPAGATNANANASAPLQTQPSQMPQQQRFVQQPGGPPNQSPTHSRPPLTNSFPSQGGAGPERSRPPSYSGSSRSEEMLVADRTSDNGRIQRQNGRRAAPTGKSVSGPRPPTSSSGGSSPPRTSTGYPMTHPQLQHAQAQAKSASSSDPNLAGLGASVGASIQRLKSPSVADCVLQPLDQKVREYADLMSREQEEMDHLDAELRALQERRADAETRFLEAKGKHDDYRRQYNDVERAMRGETIPPPTPREQQVPLARQHTRPMSLRDDDDDDEDDDDMVLPPSSHRRINSQQSFGRSSQKMKSGGRFRFSLFGDKQ
ncbi:hypothetical protein F4804DRAFT_319603 [Jackrogersella minutella]|nr:hypothetical protein F4804DRAFT_319603 [Jackrogersella minutella]